MDRVGLLGVSWRHASSATLAQFTLPREGRGARLRALASVLEVDELVNVAACNRVDVLLAGGRMLPLTERRRGRAEGVVQRLGHAPTRGLRDLAGRAGPAAAADFLGTTVPDLAAALRTRAAPWRATEELP